MANPTKTFAQGYFQEGAQATVINGVTLAPAGSGPIPNASAGFELFGKYHPKATSLDNEAYVTSRFYFDAPNATAVVSKVVPFACRIVGCYAHKGSVASAGADLIDVSSTAGAVGQIALNGTAAGGFKAITSADQATGDLAEGDTLSISVTKVDNSGARVFVEVLPL